MNNRGDIEFALRLKTDLEQGQRELQGLAQTVEGVGAGAATSSAELNHLGETADQAAARLRGIAEAAVQQKVAADAAAASMMESANATRLAGANWQENAAAQNESMRAYHAAERAAQEKAQADLRAAEAAAQAAAATEKEAQELQQLLGKIDPVIRKLDELDNMEQQLRRARASGQIDLDTFDDFNTKLLEQRQRLGGTTDAMRVAGITAGQYQQAMRQLPMQITDITTSLASGMPVWLVAIQQGGQIADSFGGVGNAIDLLTQRFQSLFGLGDVVDLIGGDDGLSGAADEAQQSLSDTAEAANNVNDAAHTVGSSLAGMGLGLNPLTLAIAAVTAGVAATVVAMVQGAAETYEYEKAITLTGNSAGVTSDQLAGMARQISSVSGTQRQAAAALAEITASGKFTADQIQLIGTTAVLMQNNVGQAISATVDDFKKLAEEPAEASAKLNVEYNYLTLAVYEQIAALEAQGDQAGATQLAMEALAEAMQSRSEEIAEKLGLIESAWKGITNVAAVAWDAMLGIGREETLDDQLAAIQRRRQAAQFGVRGDRVAAGIDPALEARLAAEEEGIRRQIALEAEQAKQKGEAAAAEREAIEASKERTKAGDAFVKSAEAQLQSLQNLTSVERAQRVMQEQNIEATSELGKRMLEAAEATDKQREANQAEADAKRAATEEQRKATAALREQERAAQAALRATEQSVRQQLSYVQGLEDQAAKIGLTAAEVRQYELAEKGLTGAMRARADAALALIDAAEAQRQADANARTNVGLEAEFLRAAGRETDAALLEIRTKFAGMRTEFEKVGNDAGLAWLDKLIPVAEAKVRVDDVQREMDRILAEQQRQEQSVNVQQDAGLITELQARERILEIHRETYAQLEQIRPVLAELAAQPGAVGEAAAQALYALDSQAQRLMATTTLLQETLRDGLTSGLTDALTGLAKGTLDIRDAVSAVAESVSNAMLRMASENIAQSISGGVMSLFGGAQEAVGLTTGAAAVTTSAGALSAAGGTLLTGAAAIQAAAASLAAANAASSVAGVASVAAATGGHVTGPGTGTSDSIRAWLSNNEFVTRASVVTQPGMLPVLHDINARGWDAINDLTWSGVYHNTGGLAGVPAPAMASPGLGTARLAEPAKNLNTTLRNQQDFYLIDDPARIADVMSGTAGREAIAVALSREPGKFRSILEMN